MAVALDVHFEAGKAGRDAQLRGQDATVITRNELARTVRFTHAAAKLLTNLQLTLAASAKRNARTQAPPETLL